ncbi:MAG: enoyl-CoA hydratase/isomerase family protein [Alphaproteobacteria bacterium]
MTNLPNTKDIELELADGWLTLWFNRPDNRNALTQTLGDELRDVFAAVRDDRTVRGIVLRGRGGTFCAGGDLKGFKGNQDGGASHADIAASNRAGGVLFKTVTEAPQVVVAAVEGHALAGGLGLVCCSDVAIVDVNAKFALTETALGIVPAQIAPHVVARVGFTTARRLMLTGARFKGAEAVSLGIAHQAVDGAAEMEAALTQIKAQVRNCAPGANAATKQMLLAARHMHGDELSAFAADRFADCMLGDEAREGMAAFVEKRKASWSE